MNISQKIKNLEEFIAQDDSSKKKYYMCSHKSQNEHWVKKIYKCANCDKDFKASRPNTISFPFCSKRCFVEYRDRNKKPKTIKEYLCDYCGKKILSEYVDLDPRRKNKNNFCGQQCKLNWQKKYWIEYQMYQKEKYEREFTCHYCGKKFMRMDKKYYEGKRMFCNVSCVGNWWFRGEYRLEKIIRRSLTNNLFYSIKEDDY